MISFQDDYSHRTELIPNAQKPRNKAQDSPFGPGHIEVVDVTKSSQIKCEAGHMGRYRQLHNISGRVMAIFYIHAAIKVVE